MYQVNYNIKNQSLRLLPDLPCFNLVNVSDPHSVGSVSHALMVGSGLVAEIFLSFSDFYFAVQFVNFLVFFFFFFPPVRLATTTHVILRIQSSFPCL